METICHPFPRQIGPLKVETSPSVPQARTEGCIMNNCRPEETRDGKGANDPSPLD
jgi:hypothetical protein